MAIPPASPGNSTPQSPSSEPGPSKIAHSPSNKRSASVSLSDSEAMVTKTTKTLQATSRGMKTNTAVIDAYRRKRKKKKRLPITQNGSQVPKLSPTIGPPGSPKGEELVLRDKHSCDEEKDVIPAAKESDELVHLRAKLEEQTSLLNAHKEFLTSLAPSVTCQICLDPMYRPYTLAPCGHTACYDCLLAWFRAPPAHIGLPPPEHLVHNFDTEEPTLLARDAPMLLRKEKTCPHCRAIVHDAPVEAWGIKDIVHHLFNHKGDVAKELYPSYSRPQEVNQAGIGQTGLDAWRGVFKRGRVPRMLAVPNRNENEPARAMDGDDNQGGLPEPFFDEEDDVYRCTGCYHEIWNGICTSCGQIYPEHHSDFDDEDEEIDAGHWMDAEDFDGFYGDHVGLDDVYGGPDADIGIRGIMGALGFRRNGANRAHEGGEDEEAYESSFIDDEDDHTRMEEYHSAEEAGTYETEDERDRMMREFHEDDHEEDHLPRRVPPPRVEESDDEAPPPRVRLGAIEVLDSDSDVTGLPVNRVIRRNRILVDSDDDDDDDDDDDASVGSQHARHASGLSRSRRPIIDDSDSEQEQDQRSHLGVRRNFRAFSRSLSDEGSLSGDGSDHSSQHESFRGSVSGLSHENYENYAFSDEDNVWSD